MNVISAEWTKLRTVRSTYWTLAMLVVLTIGIGFWTATQLKKDLSPANIANNLDELNQIGIIILIGLLFLSQVVVTVLGSMTITSEYGSGMIRTSLTAVSSRIGFALSKGLVLLATVFVVAFVAALITVQGIALPVIFGSRANVNSGEAWKITLFGALYVTLVAAMAYGFGLALRHTAAAISVTLGLVFVLPIIGNLIPHASALAKYSPMNAGEHMLYLHKASGELAPGLAVLIMVLWAVAALLYGFVTISVRDS